MLVFARVHVVAELIGGKPELGLETETGQTIGLGILWFNSPRHSASLPSGESSDKELRGTQRASGAA